MHNPILFITPQIIPFKNAPGQELHSQWGMNTKYTKSYRLHWYQYWYTPFKESNATQLWSIILLLSWIFIHQVRDPWKACLFAFRLMPYLLGLFHWGNVKRKSCKIDRIVWEMHALSSFGLSFCECMHAYPLPIHCAEILRIRSILQLFLFDIAPNLLTLHDPQWNNPNK